MLKVVAFMKQVAEELRMGETLVRRTYIAAAPMPSLLIVGKGFFF